MIKHYLITSIRNLRRNYLYSIINIIGLTLGITCVIFVFAWIYDEISYDNFHPNVSRVYRVESLMDFESPTLWTQTPAPLEESLKRDFNEVLFSTKIKKNYKPIIKLGNEPILESGFYFVTPDFFRIFGIEVLAPNPEKLISEPFSILVSESTAKKYFGSENPIGKTLEVNQKYIYKIQGVFKDYPENSHLEFKFIAAFDNLSLSDKEKFNWDRYNYITYITIKPDADIGLFSSKLKNYIANFMKNPISEFHLQKVKDIHLHADSGEGNILYIYIFSVIGVLLLAIAFINFINISTAKALERVKEIAIRKTIGATRKLLRQQIYSELLLLVAISIFLAFIITIYLIPEVNNLTNKEFTFNILFNKELVLTILVLIILSVIISGFYPAIYLSSFDPGIIISNKSYKRKGSLLRKFLVSVQLTISIVLIIGAVVIQKQMHFMCNKNLGFDKDQLMYVNLNYKESKKFKTVGESLKELSSVGSIAYSHHLPIDAGQFSHIRQWDGHMASDEAIMVNEMYIDNKFLPVYNIKIKEGRNFRDYDNEYKIIINQKAAKKMGLTNPIGTKIYMGEKYIYEIVGVTEDFHFRPLSNKIAPMLLYYEPVNHYITLKLNTKNYSGTLKKIEKKVKKILPEYPFLYGFVDEEIEGLYRTEIRISKLVGIFTVIAVITSCLGIFGLSAFMAESRTKEIGIRKALGSPTNKIIYLMTREIFIISSFANIVGGVIGYKILLQWLNNFEYKIKFTPGIFILVLVISILIALLTTSFHAIKSSKVNPAKILKYE